MIDAFLHPAVIAGMTFAIGALGGAMGARWKAKPDVQAVTNAAVAGIIQHYTQALKDQTDEVHSLRTEIAEMRETIEAQSREIAELNNHILDMSAVLERNGLPAPPRRPAYPLSSVGG